MRLATFNLESLDLPPKAKVPIEVRAEALRPMLERLQADILCLQEVNGQHVAAHDGRSLLALNELLAGTRYANYARVATTGAKGHGAADVHNLVTLSRLPIVAHRELLHGIVTPPLHRLQTAIPPAITAEPIRFDRPILVSDIELTGGQCAPQGTACGQCRRATALGGTRI
jgi:endonuclease/exonuclease/phosphatase family metal-dependent hydrolase